MGLLESFLEGFGQRACKSIKTSGAIQGQNQHPAIPLFEKNVHRGQNTPRSMAFEIIEGLEAILTLVKRLAGGGAKLT